MKNIAASLLACSLVLGCHSAPKRIVTPSGPNPTHIVGDTPQKIAFSPNLLSTRALQNPLYGIWGNTAGDTFVVGTEGTILRSQKGEPFTGEAMFSGVGLTDIWGDGTTAFVSGWYGYMLRTKDGGDSWERLSTGSSDSFLGVWGASIKDIYAVGSGGAIIHSTDGGKTWPLTYLPAAGMFYAVWGSSAKDVYAVGNGGFIAHSKDGGATWITQTKDPEMGFPFTYFVGVWGSSAKDVYVVGHEGYLLHSTDEGQTWTQQKLPDFQPLGVWGTSADDVYVFGEAGKLMRSVDKGKTWQSVETGTSNYICGFWGRDANSIIMVGDQGLLTRLAPVKTNP
jgi:photosystem II stability/assembly factor-like uncharacterized protein